MPRAPNDRPSRRLDAILASLVRHGVRTFEAAKLDGIGDGLKWTFRPPAPPARARAGRGAPDATDPDLGEDEAREPIDELALVAEGREGPVPDSNGVS